MRRVIIKRLVLLLLLMVLMASCASRRTVERSAVRLVDSIRWEVRYTDSVRIQTVRKDSVYLRDSVVVKIDSTGKTTDRWHVVYRYVADDARLEDYKARLDSIASTRQKDSVVVKTIYKEPTRFQKFRMDAFWVLAGIMILGLILIVSKCFS